MTAIDFLNNNPEFYRSLRYDRDSSAIPRKRTFLIGMPRSGTTLWLRLMGIACLTRTLGDKHDSYYKGLLDMYDEVMMNQGHYMHTVCEGETTGKLCDMYRGFESHERELWNFHYSAGNLLFGNTFGNGYAKSTTIGFTNNFLVPFVKMLRHLFEKDDLTICFMTRDIEQAANSLIAHPDNKLNDSHLELTVKEYEHQLKQMKEATKMGDVWIPYDKFVVDPIPYLKRCNPVYDPDKKTVAKILANKIR